MLFAKCVKELFDESVRTRLRTLPAPDCMNTDRLRRWAKRLADQPAWKALGKQQAAWSTNPLKSDFSGLEVGFFISGGELISE
jgi:hypothetical protein